jgi:hypothetical protein
VDGIKIFKKILLASALLVSSTVASHAIVLFSDNFSSSGLGTPATPTGWTLDFGSVDVIGTGSYDFYPGNNNYIDMNGTTKQSGRMHTNAAFSFLAGKTYTLSFNYGNNSNSAGNGSTETLVASVLGFPGVTINQVGVIASYLLGSYTFTAVSNFSSALYFNASGTNDDDNGGLILDNVSLSVVPVPAALPLLAGGLGILGFASRRRTAKAVA